MKYLIVGQNGHGERLYRRARSKAGWEWTYFRPDAKRFPDRKSAEKALARDEKRHGVGFRFVVRVDQDIDFRHYPPTVIFRSRTRKVL